MKAYTNRFCLFSSLSTFILAALCAGRTVAQDRSFLTNGLVLTVPFDGAPQFVGNFGTGPLYQIEVLKGPAYPVPWNPVGTAMGITPTENRFSQTNSAYQLNGGLPSYVDEIYSALNQSRYTISVWAKHFGRGLYVFPFGNISSFPDNTWTSLIVTFDGYKLKRFANGIEEKGFSFRSPDAMSLNLNPTSGFRQGQFGQNGIIVAGQYGGAIDDLRVYDRPFSASEVLALYNYEKNPPPLDSLSTATATAQVVNGFVVGTVINWAGSGYTNAPNITFIGGGGTGASARANLSFGYISSITILNPGSGYTNPPTMQIAPPPFPPTRATATSTISSGQLSGFTIIQGGHGYGGVPPSVTLFGGGGTGASAIARVGNGMVTEIAVVSTGTGYTTPPRVRIDPPPGYPALSIDVQSINLNLNLVVGTRYKIQTSSDGAQTWSDSGIEFEAAESNTSIPFSVRGVSQLFRVIQLD